MAEQSGGVTKGIQPSVGVPGVGVSAPTPQNQQGLDQPQKLPDNPNLSAMQRNQEAMAQGAGKGESGKVYRSFPGSSFFAKDGTRFEFDAKGEMRPDNAAVIAELELIADKPGSPIYAKGSKATPAPGDDLPVTEIQERAAQVIAELKAKGQAV